jgi:hypothetical protein
MQVEWYCPCCCSLFAASPETPFAQVLEQMSEEGPWYTLGDGETFEDVLFTALTSQGEVLCRECGEPLTVSEENLGRLTQEMLASW